jgi:hypothetical protein
LGGTLVLTLGGFYLSVDHYDRAAGGDAGVFELPSTTAVPVVAGATTVPGPAPSTTQAGPTALRLVIVGDSTAHALAINQPDGLEDTLDVTDGSVSGCSVYDGGQVDSARDGFSNSFAPCADWREDWVDAATDSDAEVALVVLGAWDVFDVETPDGERLSFGSAEWDDYVSGQLESGIEALVATGAEVALLEVPCMRPQQVEGAAVPPLPERADDTHVEHVNELWREVAAADPTHVTFVEGPTEWCHDESISTSLGYRWDGVHVYGPGAKLIYETIAPALLDLES